MIVIRKQDSLGGSEISVIEGVSKRPDNGGKFKYWVGLRPTLFPGPCQKLR